MHWLAPVADNRRLLVSWEHPPHALLHIFSHAREDASCRRSGGELAAGWRVFDFTKREKTSV